MKKSVVLLIYLFVMQFTFAQMYKAKKSKSDFFGKREVNNRQIGNFAMNVTLGPTFTKAFDQKNNTDFQLTDVNGTNLPYEITQKGKVGAHIGAGLNFFNSNPGWFSFGRIVDYFELGLSFSYYRGIESLEVKDANGREIEALSGQGKYQLGWLTPKLGIHKIFPITNTKMFLDNGLSFNGNLALLQAEKTYSNNIVAQNYFSPTFTAQLNFFLGLGFQLKRGSYLIPSVYMPILSLSEFGKQSVHWFSSRYYPINCQLKLLYRFNKRRSKTSCTTIDKAPIPAPEEGK